MKRLTASFEPATAYRLERLAEETGLGKSGVIREALALEEVFQKYKGQGATFIVRMPNGDEKEIVRA